MLLKFITNSFQFVVGTYLVTSHNYITYKHLRIKYRKYSLAKSRETLYITVQTDLEFTLYLENCFLTEFKKNVL